MTEVADTFRDTFKVTGHLKIEVFGPDGSLKDVREVKNLVVTAGKGFIASRMGSAAAAVMGWMELGTGTTAAAAGDTTLQAVIAASRVALTSATVATNNITYVGTWGAGVGTGAVTEAGVFNQVTAGGTMLSRTVFAVVTKGAGDTMTITWVVTIN